MKSHPQISRRSVNNVGTRQKNVDFCHSFFHKISCQSQPPLQFIVGIMIFAFLCWYVAWVNIDCADDGRRMTNVWRCFDGECISSLYIDQPKVWRKILARGSKFKYRPVGMSAKVPCQLVLYNSNLYLKHNRIFTIYTRTDRYMFQYKQEKGDTPPETAQTER